MIQPTPDQISQALHLPHTTGAARLRAEIIGCLTGQPVPDAPPAPQRYSSAPPLPAHGLRQRPKRRDGPSNLSRLITRLQHGPIDMTQRQWLDVTDSQTSFYSTIYLARKNGYTVTLRDRTYVLE